MALGYNVYKAIGAIYDIGEIETTARGYRKREVWLEMPTTVTGHEQRSEIPKFVVFGDEAEYLDNYSKGDWVAIMFRLNGRFWLKPETKEKIHFNSLNLIDIHKIDNPFKSQDTEDTPDALSPDPVVDLAKDVKDRSRWGDRESEEDDMFKPIDKEYNDLPF